MAYKILNVFYGADNLPYKDRERSVHFPIIGSAFQGASDTTEIHFYFDRIGEPNTAWVAVSKLPNGKIGSKVLDVAVDDELNENYAVFRLSSFHTQYKGDLYVSLQGYRGDAGFSYEYDEEQDLYVIHGTPTIQATGSVKLNIAYATQFVGSGEESNTDLQALLGLLGTKLNIANGVVVLEDIENTDLSSYEVGQLAFDKETKSYYEITNGGGYSLAENNGILGSKHTLVRYYGLYELGDIYNLASNKLCLVQYQTVDYLVQFEYDGEDNLSVRATNLSNLKTYYHEINASFDLDHTMSDLIVNDNEKTIATDYDLQSLRDYIEELLQDNYVPYEGALENLDLGNHNVKAKQVQVESSSNGLKIDDDGNLELFATNKKVVDMSSQTNANSREIANAGMVLNHAITIQEPIGQLQARMSQDNYNYALNKNAKIICGDNYYIKQSEDLATMTFKSIKASFSTSGDHVVITSDKTLTITKEPISSQRQYTVSDNSVNVYNTAQTDNKFANEVAVSINTTTYVMTISIKNANGDTISSANVDLPLESIITSARYYDTYTYDTRTYTKVIVITLSTTDVPVIVPVGSLIEGLVNVSDIVDNLTSTATNKPLSAKQGKVLKDTVDTKANASDVYTKQETYNSNEIDTMFDDVGDILENKANVDGNYPTMTTGNAEQLISSIGEEDNAPYLYRTSGGSVSIGNRVNEKYIEGGSIAIAQKVNHGNFDSASGWSTQGNRGTISVSNNVLTYTKNLSSADGIYRLNIGYTTNHKYLAFAYVNPSRNTRTYISFRAGFATGVSIVETTDIEANKWTLLVGIKEYNVSYTDFNIGIASGYFDIDDTLQIKNANCIDLTATFGSTIADYLATLPIEQALAKIKQWIDVNKYYEYNANPQFKHVNLLKKQVVGVNQWNEQYRHGGYNDQTGEYYADARYLANANPIEVVANQNYYFHCGKSVSILVFAYDSNMNYIGLGRAIDNNATDVHNKTFSVPSNTKYINFYCENYSEDYSNNICINISWSGARNGEYKPYELTEYDMPTGTLRGILKLDENNNIVYDGDRHYADGHTEVRYGIVDLGTLSWNKATNSQGRTYFWALVQNMKTTGSQLNCEKYTFYQSSYISGVSTQDKIITNHTPQDNREINIFDTSLDSLSRVDFKTAVSGIYLVYELATPTTTQGIPYTEIQKVDDWGTEQFINVDNVDMPVGHNSFYQLNLRDKLQNLPNNATNDGLYLVKQTGSQQSLVPYQSVIDNSEVVHDIRVNTTTAQGTYNYQFELPTTDTTAYTQLGQAGHYLYVNKPGVKIPASGVYVEGTTLYVITSVRSSTNDNMVIVEMYKVSDGTQREIETGVVDVNDTIL